MSVLLVTGGSRGIGADVARLASERGWHVGINYTADEDSAQNVASDVRDQGMKATVVRADISKPDDVEKLFSRTAEELGQITGVVNSAGIATGIGPIEELDIEATHRMLEINVFGLFLCCRAAVQRMAKRHGGQGGAIVNISSAASRSYSPGSFVDYAAGKAAVDTLTIGLAKEQAPQGICVFGVRPGVINTDMVKAGAELSPEWLKTVVASTPNGRIGEVRDVSGAVLWLLSEEARHSTGSIIDISGGRATQ
ncbi:MAG: SDR family oxidoreductase [Rhodospirillaceae bacterium]|jgi:NAD(P)-dependent dehydrogenase (short-subunit alcohol dehydrogenase family)|nr:SDR family oxidoreductase [Rhodospirillaceae bacterium]MBT5048043.1 SDR family oxidoreductase [Rhodospirillaceae bacterium]MBT5899089.1 SDR family oxidoreductase [Rhodospirillaceae bacterium]